DVRAHPRRGQDVVRPLAADPVDVGQADLDPLGSRQVHSSDACHLSLPLLVLLIRADHAHHATAADDLALVANSLHRCSDLHNFSTILPRDTSRGLSSNRTRSPISTRMKLRPGPLGTCAVICRGPSISTRYCAYGKASRTTPTAVIARASDSRWSCSIIPSSVRGPRCGSRYATRTGRSVRISGPDFVT